MTVIEGPTVRRTEEGAPSQTTNSLLSSSKEATMLASRLAENYQTVRVGTYGAGKLDILENLLKGQKDAWHWAQTNHDDHFGGRLSKSGSWVYRYAPIFEFDGPAHNCHWRITINARVCPELLPQLEEVLKKVDCCYKFGTPDNVTSILRYDSIVIYLLTRPPHEVLVQLAPIIKEFSREQTPLTAETDGLQGLRIQHNGQTIAGMTIETSAKPAHIQDLLTTLCDIDPLLIEALALDRSKHQTRSNEDRLKFSTGQVAALRRTAKERGLDIDYEPVIVGFTIKQDNKPIIMCDRHRNISSWEELNAREFEGTSTVEELQALFLGILPRHTQDSSKFVETLQRKVDIPGSTDKSVPDPSELDSIFSPLMKNMQPPGRQMLLEFSNLYQEAFEVSIFLLHHIKNADEQLSGAEAQKLSRLFPPLNIADASPLFLPEIKLSNFLTLRRHGLQLLTAEYIQSNLFLGLAEMFQREILPTSSTSSSKLLKQTVTCEKAIRAHLLSAPDPRNLSFANDISISEAFAVLGPLIDPNNNLAHRQQLLAVTKFRTWLQDNDTPTLEIMSPPVVEKAQEIYASFPMTDLFTF